MKRLIKSEFYDASKINSDYIEIFKNPTDKEKNIIIDVNPVSGVRGILTTDGDMYIWSGKYWHSKILREFSIPNGIHFATVGDTVEIYLTTNDNIEKLHTSFVNNIDKFNLLINSDADLHLDTSHYGSLVNFDENIIKNIHTMDDILNLDGVKT